MKDHHPDVRTNGLGGHRGASARCTPVLRVGHPTLDAALATERHPSSDLRALHDARLQGMDARRRATDAPARGCGHLARAMALTPDRHGRGPALHVATTHRVTDARGRARTITVWHALTTFDRN